VEKADEALQVLRGSGKEELFAHKSHTAQS
jgi:hypothetical protein